MSCSAYFAMYLRVGVRLLVLSDKWKFDLFIFHDSRSFTMTGGRNVVVVVDGFAGVGDLGRVEGP